MSVLDVLCHTFKVPLLLVDWEHDKWKTTYCSSGPSATPALLGHDVGEQSACKPRTKLSQTRRVRDSSCSKIAAPLLDVPIWTLQLNRFSAVGPEKVNISRESPGNCQAKIHHTGSDGLKSCSHHPQHVIVTENSLKRLSVGFRPLPRLRQLLLVLLTSS